LSFVGQWNTQPIKPEHFLRFLFAVVAERHAYERFCSRSCAFVEPVAGLAAPGYLMLSTCHQVQSNVPAKVNRVSRRIHCPV
jgi:hypothetical protein